MSGVLRGSSVLICVAASSDCLALCVSLPSSVQLPSSSPAQSGASPPLLGACLSEYGNRLPRRRGFARIHGRYPWGAPLGTFIPRPLGQSYNLWSIRFQTHTLFLYWNHNKKSYIIFPYHSMKNVRLNDYFVPYILSRACEVVSHGWLLKRPQF